MLNQKGMATIEIIPILMLFVVLINFSFGFFGIIHSGILNSIAARNYAFESFRARSNLNYLRDEGDVGARNPYFSVTGIRFHGIVGEHSHRENEWVATIRPIKFTDLKTGAEALATSEDHNTKVRRLAENKKTSETFVGKTKDDGNAGVGPVWIMTSYGICLNVACGNGGTR